MLCRWQSFSPDFTHSGDGRPLYNAVLSATLIHSDHPTFQTTATALNRQRYGLSRRLAYTTNVTFSDVRVTDRISRENKAVSSDRPSVRLFPLYIFNQLAVEHEFLYVHGLRVTLARLWLKVKIIRSRLGSKVKLRVRVRVVYYLTAATALFYCHVVSCALARRGVRRATASPASAAESSACGCDNAVGLTSILDRRQLFLVYQLQMVNNSWLIDWVKG